MTCAGVVGAAAADVGEGLDGAGEEARRGPSGGSRRTKPMPRVVGAADGAEPGGEDHGVAAALQRASEQDLVVAEAVDVGAVEVVHAVVDGVGGPGPRQPRPTGETLSVPWPMRATCKLCRPRLFSVVAVNPAPA